MGTGTAVRDWADRLFSIGRRRAPGSPAAAGSLVVLYSRDPELVGDRLALGAAPAVTTVGRGVDNTVMLDGDSVSRSHARFEQRADGWWVIDCGSTNGTFVNDEQVREALLHPGDHVRLGDTILRLEDTRPSGG